LRKAAVRMKWEPARLSGRINAAPSNLQEGDGRRAGRLSDLCRNPGSSDPRLGISIPDPMGRNSAMQRAVDSIMKTVVFGT
jgi:hypothetical protein